MKLKWIKQQGDAWFAYSFKLHVAMVVKRSGDGLYAYKVDGVDVKWIAKGSGVVKTKASAVRQVERAWNLWLGRAGLFE